MRYGAKPSTTLAGSATNGEASPMNFNGRPANVPRDGSPGGLVWFLVGETVRALGPAHAITESGRNFLREKDFDAGLLQGGAIK